MPPKKPITPDALYQLKHVEDPQLSPDGRWVAYVVRTQAKLDNAYERHIWLLDLADRAATPRQFTFGAKSDLAPRWRPDGTALAFVSLRGGKPQVYYIALAGGEAWALTSSANGAVNPVWSPDGKQLAYLSDVNADERQAEDEGKEPPSPSDSLDARHRGERKAEDEKRKLDPRVIQKLPYRTGTEYYDDRTTHLYVMAVDANGKAEKARRLTDGDRDYTHIDWFPDGRAILSSQSGKPESDPWFFQRPVRIPTSGAHRQTFLTPPGFEYTEARVSPDGRWIVANRQSDRASFGEPLRMVVFPARGGAVIERAVELDRLAGHFTWSADSRRVFFTAEDRGDTGLYVVDVTAGKARRVVGGRRVILNYSLARTGRIAFVAHTPAGPADLTICESDGKRERQATDLNAGWRAEHAVAPIEEVWHAAPDGRRIQGWQLLPPVRERGAKVPLVLNMHGGPWVMWGPSVPEVWLEMQVLAGAGYAVYYCNPRGSLGYGGEHALLIHNDWGNHVMHDILSGVDAIVARGVVDPKRMAVTGGSYAGYMTAWIIGHDQRFACAWAQRGLYNLTSFFGTSDIPQLIEREFDARGFEDIERLWEQSPLAYVQDMHTPLVIEHQDNDWRCPPSEGEQLYAALKRLGRTVTLLRYPREGHEMTRSGEPGHRVDRLNRMVAWFGTYCGKKAKRRA
ncbi:MAG: S9 family peptidase [Anaerolineales bacterium]|nr:S9 family peptidase [Anaerolineales bacterium]